MVSSSLVSARRTAGRHVVCPEENGEYHPMYRRLMAVEHYMTDESTGNEIFILYTESAEFMECFKSSDIHVHIVPPPSTNRKDEHFHARRKLLDLHEKRTGAVVPPFHTAFHDDKDEKHLESVIKRRRHMNGRGRHLDGRRLGWWNSIASSAKSAFRSTTRKASAMIARGKKYVKRGIAGAKKFVNAAGNIISGGALNQNMNKRYNFNAFNYNWDSSQRQAKKASIVLYEKRVSSSSQVGGGANNVIPQHDCSNGKCDITIQPPGIAMALKNGHSKICSSKVLPAKYKAMAKCPTRRLLEEDDNKPSTSWTRRRLSNYGSDTSSSMVTLVTCVNCYAYLDVAVNFKLKTRLALGSIPPFVCDFMEGKKKNAVVILVNDSFCCFLCSC